MRNARIVATGMCVPDRIIPNRYFNDQFQEDVDAWLRENVHIYERRWCHDDEATASLCLRAAQQCLDNAGIAAASLDLIIVATDTPEYVSPATASIVQYQLGAVNAGAFDLNAACAGFVTALDTGARYIRSDDQYRHVLVIGAYAMSKYLNRDDKKTVTLFADGAGAVLLGVTDVPGEGFRCSKLISRGQYYDWMGIYGGGARHPANEAMLREHGHQLRFVRKFPKELNPEMWTMIIRDLCMKINIPPDDIAHFFITQININSLWETMDRLQLPHSKVHTIMHHYGYTGSACIPMALHDALQRRQIRSGDLIALVGSGGGLAFAGAIFQL